ncbi:MAG: S41 family peptidase [Fimbriimonadales bacterium]|nr:S41 family peptidase [Fimbriimonadales bacterium]
MPRAAVLLASLLATLTLAPLARPQARAAEPFGPAVKEAVLQRVEEILTRNAYVPGVDFSKWPEIVATEKQALDEAKDEAGFVQAVNRAFRRLGISHIVLATPKAAQARRERKAIGIGVGLQREEGGLRVINLFPQSPAAEAGIQLGDVIVEVDGQPATDLNQLSGEEGQQLKLKVRKVDGKSVDLALTRRAFSTILPDTLRWVDGETAVLKVHSFDRGYDRQNIERLIDEAKNAKQLILDLRGNGGGAVANFMHLLAQFLPQDTPVGTFVSRRMVERYVEETKGDPTDLRAIARWSDSKVKPSRTNRKPFAGRVAVLVDRRSGSASEIVAAALQEHLDAPVVGTPSAGAVLVSVMASLPGGFQLQYPISDYVTMEGVRLEGTGVRPTLEVAPPRFGEPDHAVAKAAALLERARLREERFRSANAT